MNHETGYYKFSNLEELNHLAQKENKTLLILDGYVIDPTTFAAHHPGGKGLILKHQGLDITADMQEHHPLSLQLAQSMVIGSFKKDIKRLLNPRKPLASQIWNLSR